jgi:hypothetical protein
MISVSISSGSVSGADVSLVTARLQKKNKGPKRSKTEHLKINATIDIQPDKIPAGSTFKGYREVVIQDIVFETFNTCYRLAQYQTPDGGYISGQLPD